MTTDLEKQFFDTFGIEPKYEDACELVDEYLSNEDLANEYGVFDNYMEAQGCPINKYGCTDNCRHVYAKEKYPQITDRILLELICLLNTITHPDLGDVYVEKLKTTVLQEYLKMFDSDFWENEEKAKKEFIEEVQALFKE